MRIKWLDDAVYDLQALHRYIFQDKPTAAHRVAQRILDTINFLNEQSGLGRHGRVPGTRELVVSGTPYIVIYRVKDNSLEILRVLHVAMQWPEKT